MNDGSLLQAMQLMLKTIDADFFDRYFDGLHEIPDGCEKETEAEAVWTDFDEHAAK